MTAPTDDGWAAVDLDESFEPPQFGPSAKAVTGFLASLLLLDAGALHRLAEAHELGRPRAIDTSKITGTYRGIALDVTIGLEPVVERSPVLRRYDSAAWAQGTIAHVAVARDMDPTSRTVARASNVAGYAASGIALHHLAGRRIACSDIDALTCMFHIGHPSADTAPFHAGRDHGPACRQPIVPPVTRPPSLPHND